MKTPVALFLFNRPEKTAQVFERIRQAQPTQLFLIADGPRPQRPEDQEKCLAARAVVEQVDWDCQVLKDYSDQNLGCGLRMYRGISWVFEQVESAIFLEDDCLPHPTFFPFCAELLERYAADQRVMHISGCNYQFGQRRTQDSYYFSRYPHCWGWASWRRAWQYYDFEMKLLPEILQGDWLKDYLGEPETVRYWLKSFRLVNPSTLDIWDYQWTLTCWLQHGLSILPTVNLVSNIGFGVEATHTKDYYSFADPPVEAMTFPLRHPPFMMRDAQADRFSQNHFFQPPLSFRVQAKINKVFKGLSQVFSQGQTL